MSTRALAAVLASTALASFALAACGDDTESGASSTTTTSSTTSTTGSGGATGTGGTAQGGAAPGGGGQGGTNQGGGPCAAAATDDACTACSKTACCTELESCAGDTACACWLPCRASGKNYNQCFGTCGSPTEATQSLLLCAQTNCPACGL